MKQILRFRRPLRQLYRLVITPVCLALAIYGGFCLLWGTYYYGDDFVTQSGLETGAVSTEELRTVTTYFADLANTYSAAVPRDENGVCATDRKAVLERSPRLYQGLEEEFPCLAGPGLRAKSIGCSRILSYLDFTGFFFPFTGEANVNIDFPPSLFASTVAHELAHQRGVAKEQETNFVAVAAINLRRSIAHGQTAIPDKFIPSTLHLIRTILRIAYNNGQRRLVLGAFGCGAFANPPGHMAQLFKQVFEEPEFQGVFREICFAIIEDHNSQGKNYNAFQAVFSS